ncbi:MULTISPECIES: DUF4112 domain-containing protein [unclassified Schlesneria]|uniref:DUF4112 domain-containing protein n=2 Tax=Planctomycetaceae TaxID=126 RepID=UPI0035A12EA8
MISPTTKKATVEPEVISNSERQQRIQQLQAIAELLDGQFKLPGTNIQFGLDALIGLVPGIGDFVSGGISIWLVREAQRLGAPKWLIARMMWNVVVDVSVGAVPLVGDVFDAAWKANRKNMALLNRHFSGQSK